MTDNNHPITPPEELLQEWCQQGRNCMSELNALKELATQAARWGADMELEACCEWFAKRYGKHLNVMGLLRNARRPKPPSLVEEALGLLNEGPVSDLHDHEVAVIRCALERLQELEEKGDE